MKNILIAGTVRSGKSTLSKMLYKKLKYSIIESDALVSTFEKVFPELNISHKKAELTKHAYSPFINRYLKETLKNLDYSNIPSAICGGQFLPELLNNFEQKNRYIIIFLGVSDLTPQELYKNIRLYDGKNDWTRNYEDKKLLNLCNQIVETSHFYKTECEKYGFKYFDTGKNRNKTLKQILKYIKQENKK